MQSGEHDSGNHEGDVDRLDQRVQGPEEGSVEEPVLEDCRAELQEEHAQLEHHTHGHFEKHGVDLGMHQGMPDMPGQSEIVEQTHRDGHIA